MSSIATAVFKATIGLLVNKGRDKAAEKLKDGDVTDQKLRELIVREIDDINDKLDALSRKDLGASISSLKQGIALLYEVFNKARIRNEDGAATPQAALDLGEAFTLAEEMTMLELTDLDETAKRELQLAKERFQHARDRASEAFNNTGLNISDRILAMHCQVMAIILETVDNPDCAIQQCRVCIAELNSLSAVQNSFDAQLKKGENGIQALRSLLGKDERRKIISSVCHVNRVIYDVTQTVRKDEPLWMWPALKIGEVDPLRDRRVAKVLRKQGMEHCHVPWSFGLESEEEHTVRYPVRITTNSSGQFIIADHDEVQIFDPTGQFIQHLSFPDDDGEAKLEILDVATNNKDNIYVLVEGIKKNVVCEFSNSADLHHKFPVDAADAVQFDRLAVTSSKVVVLKRTFPWQCVDVYNTDGLFVCSFGEGILEDADDITAAHDGRIMLLGWLSGDVHIFSEDGVHLNQFKFKKFCPLKVAFHSLTEHVILGGLKRGVCVGIYTKDGDFVCSTEIHECALKDLTVTRDGRIALLVIIDDKCKVLVI